MKKLISCLFLLSTVHIFAQSLSGVSLGVDGNLNGWLPGTPANPWRQDISSMPVASTNSTWHSENDGGYLHPDFGSYFGIPYNVVDNTTPYITIVNTPGYADQSDITAIQLSSSTAIEGGHACPSGYDGDRHGIVLNKDTGFLFETYNLWDCPQGFVVTDSTALWDTTIDEARPWGWTSVDASGLSVFMGLVKYDEANSGTINHAIRYTNNRTACGSPNGEYTSIFVLPATHGACTGAIQASIMGLRIRLQASFDETPYAGKTRLLAIIHAMKKYGMILADNGSKGFFSGTQDSRWNDDENSLLKNIPLSAFDSIQYGTVMDSDHLPTGTLPTVSSPTINPSTLFMNQSTTVSWSSSGSSYDYVENGLPSRTGSSQLFPLSSGAYVVRTSNQYGRTTSSPTALSVLIPPFLGAVYKASGVIPPVTLPCLFCGNIKLTNVPHN